MKRNFIGISLLSILMLTSTLVGCSSKGSSSASSSIQTSYTVTFKQANQKDIVLSVKGGESLTNIPVPVNKVGYSVSWDRTNFTNINENLVVNAIENAKTYKATYCALGYEIDGTTVNLTYDSVCSSLDMSLEEDNYTFLGWKFNNAIYTNESVWNVPYDATLIAEWKENEKAIVTFVNIDQTRVYKTVYIGKDLTDIPTPKAKLGYTVTWDRTDFTNIKEDIIVTAIATANTYIATYNAPGFEIDGKTTNLTFDAKCTSLDMSLEKAEYIFTGWKYDNVIYTNESIWNIADNVTLTAEWKEKTKYIVTFIDSDGSYIYRSVISGEDLTDIPTPTPKAGYIVTWDRTDFTNITENITVKTIETPKTFTVILDANGGSVSISSIDVTFGESYTLEKPIHDEYKFNNWKYSDQVVDLSGIWNIDSGSETITLLAEWGESEWTPIH